MQINLKPNTPNNTKENTENKTDHSKEDHNFHTINPTHDVCQEEPPDIEKTDVDPNRSEEEDVIKNKSEQSKGDLIVFGNTGILNTSGNHSYTL